MRPNWGTHRPHLARYGFRFQESSKAAGIDFKHTCLRFSTPSLQHIMPRSRLHGRGGFGCRFRSRRVGRISTSSTAARAARTRFIEISARRNVSKTWRREVGLADVNQRGTGASTGAVWGDYDNDGYDDVLIYKWGRPELFHNDGGKHFTRVTEQAGLPKWVNANTAVWFDYDSDGKLDLFLGGYYSEDVDLWHLKTTKIMPESFEYANNGGRKYLFHNLGGGRFEEVSEKLGISSRRWALAAVAADLRGTGYPDLFIANDYGVSEIYFQRGRQEISRGGQRDQHRFRAEERHERGGWRCV